MTTKQTTFLRDIGFKHHPGFMHTDVSFQRQLLTVVHAHSKSVDVENITEIALAFRGKYNFVDEKARDFDDVDNSDSKTGSVNIKTRKVEVSGLGNKIGAIRLTIWNPVLDVLDFMFIPYHMWKYEYANACYGKNTEGKLRLQMTWDNKKNTYNKFEIFRINSFDDLATMTEDKFYQLHPECEYYRQIESNNSLPVIDLFDLTKIDSTPQNTSLCIEEIDSQQILDFQEIQPTSPCEIF